MQVSESQCCADRSIFINKNVVAVKHGRTPLGLTGKDWRQNEKKYWD